MGINAATNNPSDANPHLTTKPRIRSTSRVSDDAKELRVERENEWLRRRGLTAELLAKCRTSPSEPDDIGRVDYIALKIALRMQTYRDRTRRMKIRGKRRKTSREELNVKGSSVSVLKRMRHAIEHEKSDLFIRARAELSTSAARELQRLAYGDDSMQAGHPWNVFFFMPPLFPQMFGKLFPPEAECLRVLDMAIAKQSVPGRRVDRDLEDLVSDIIIWWSNLNGNELVEPSHEAGSSQRAGGMVAFIRALGRIWRLTLVSTNSGEAWRRLIALAKKKLSGEYYLNDYLEEEARQDHPPSDLRSAEAAEDYRDGDDARRDLARNIEEQYQERLRRAIALLRSSPDLRAWVARELNIGLRDGNPGCLTRE